MRFGVFKHVCREFLKLPVFGMKGCVTLVAKRMFQCSCLIVSQQEFHSCRVLPPAPVLCVCVCVRVVLHVYTVHFLTCDSERVQNDTRSSTTVHV